MTDEPKPKVIDSYEPDWGTACENCGQSPIVTGVLEGRVVLNTGMCGPCTWGEHNTIDPEEWN